MFARALFQKDGDAVARIANPAAKLLQFHLEKFVIGTPRDLTDPRQQRTQMSGDRIRYELRRPDAKLASFAEIGARFDRGEKLVHLIDEIRRQSHAGCVSHNREQALSRSRVVEPLDCRS